MNLASRNPIRENRLLKQAIHQSINNPEKHSQISVQTRPQANQRQSFDQQIQNTSTTDELPGASCQHP
jgi:hypothetical protein